MVRQTGHRIRVWNESSRSLDTNKTFWHKGDPYHGNLVKKVSSEVSEPALVMFTACT